VPRTQYCSCDKIQNEIGGTCITQGGRKGLYRVLVGTTEGKDQLGDPGVGGRILIRWIFRKWDVGVWSGSR